MARLSQLLEDRGRRGVAVSVDGGIRRLAADQAQAADRGRGFLVRGASLGARRGMASSPRAASCRASSISRGGNTSTAKSCVALRFRAPSRSADISQRSASIRSQRARSITTTQRKSLGALRQLVDQRGREALAGRTGGAEDGDLVETRAKLLEVGVDQLAGERRRHAGVQVVPGGEKGLERVVGKLDLVLARAAQQTTALDQRIRTAGAFASRRSRRDRSARMTAASAFLRVMVERMSSSTIAHATSERMVTFCS